MPSTPPCFRRVLDPPIILYAGRIKDSRKGVDVFLEAVRMLCDTRLLPAFAAWIVGGSPAEIAWLNELISQDKALENLRNCGRFVLWGRVENTALPEMFSRATVAVVPSQREEFGIVAVEAQACGCPVVASRAGGLTDIVLHKHTGTLVPPGDAATLARVLTTYLRNPDKGYSQGHTAREWVSQRFSQARVYSRYVRLYRRRPHANGYGWPDADAYAHADAVDNAKTWLPTLLRGQPPTSIRSLSTSAHSCLEVSTQNGLYFAKAYKDKPSVSASHLPATGVYEGSRSSEAMYRVDLLFAQSPVAPRQLDTNEAHRCILTEWLGERPVFDLSVLTERLANKILELQDWGLRYSNAASFNKYTRCLKAFEESRTLDALRDLDCAGASLNEHMVPGFVQFFRTHPQVEIFRIAELFRLGAWPSTSLQLGDVIDFAQQRLLEEHGLKVSAPVLCHGDLKPAHVRIRSGETVLLDPEEMHFAIGPLDLGHWAYYSCFRDVPPRDRVTGGQAVTLLRGVVPDEQELLLAVSWLVAQAAFSSLGRAVNGNPSGSNEVAGFICQAVEAIGN